MSGRILVVDDVATNRLLLKAKLEQDYYDVLTASDGPEALECAKSEQPDLILSDVIMPKMDGYTLCHALKSCPETAHIPVVMVTALNAPEERVRGLEAGADDFLEKPFDDLSLTARVRNLMRMKVMFDELRLRDETSRALGLDSFIETGTADYTSGSTVLLAHGDPERRASLTKALREGLRVQVVAEGFEQRALTEAVSTRPDAVIVHQHLAEGGNGLRLVSWLRARPQTRQCAILLIVESGGSAAAAKGLDLGASDYITCPFDFAELAARLRSQLQRKHYSDQLRSNVRDGLRMAVIDPLTGLFNRRYAMQHMQTLLEQSRQAHGSLAIMLLDLDKFKSINDNYGHPAGDAVLQEFARRMQENVRGADLTARVGGEEFCIAMPDTDFDLASRVAERVRDAVEADPFRLPDGREIRVTVSVGVSVAQAVEAQPEVMLGHADEALYASKHNGRNQVSFFQNVA